MKFSFTLFIICYINIVCSAQLPVHEEPLHHPVLENTSARVLDIKANAGDTSLVHTHSNNYVYVVLRGGKLWLNEKEDSREVNLPDGFVGGYFNNPVEPLIHRFSNISDNMVRIIAVENLNAIGNTQHTSTKSMENRTIDNKWFRVSETMIEPNERLALNFSYPSIVVNLDTSFLEIEYKGKSRKFDAWNWLDPDTQYALANPNSHELNLVIIEIK